MIKNENYDKEVQEWLEGRRLADHVGILGWLDEHKKVAIHDAILRYDHIFPLKWDENQGEQKI